MALEAFVAACRDRFDATGRLRLGEPLARHGTFAVGGPADVWLSAATEAEILALDGLAAEHDVGMLFAGNGTNVLYAAAGARGAVARVSLEAWEVAPEPGGATAILTAGAGLSLPKLINDLAGRGWAGLEWGAGVPGTVGGAIVSNAGAHGESVSDTLLTARVIDLPGQRVLTLDAAALDLRYRHSRFRATRRVAFGPDGRLIPPPRPRRDPAEVISGGTFRLRRDEPGAIRERVARFRQHRRATQPPQPSAGSVFKNPPGDHAGRLVEAAGLKGHEIGRAAISAKHANFIVNLGGALPEQIVQLIELAHATVLARFGIDLDLEVEPRGDW